MLKLIKTTRSLFVILLSFLLVYRVLLVDRGALSLLDEFEIAESINAVKYLSDGDISGFCFHLTGLGAIPVHNLFRLFPVMLQLAYSDITNTPLYHPDSMQIQQYFNVLISLLNCFLFYRISCLLLNRSKGLSLLTTFLYSLLVNTNIFIRHLLHFDLSLLCFFIAIYLLIRKNELSPKSLSLAGLFSGMGILTYTGYYYMPVFLGFYILFRNASYNDVFCTREFWKKPFWARIRQLSIYSLGFIAVIIFFEWIAYVGNTSFIWSFLELGKMPYILGSYNDGYIFLLHYMTDVEGAIGIVLLVLLLVYLVMNFYGFFKSHEKFSGAPFSNLNLFCILLLLGYLLHGTLVYYFQHKTWHGRLIHLYYPFVVLTATAALHYFRAQWLKNSVIIILCALSVYSFVVFIINYKNLGYPRDIMAERRIDTDKMPLENIIMETPSFFPFSSPQGKFKHEITPGVDSCLNIKLVNFCFYGRYIDPYQPYIPGNKDSLIFVANHYNSYKPYGYELYNRRERRLAAERNYKIKIFEAIK